MSQSPPASHLFIKLTLAALLVFALTQPIHADPLISLAFNSPNQFGASPIISGPDAVSTSANPLFGAANVWNNLNIPFGGQVNNPAWTNLVDSTGATTGVNFLVTGNVIGVDFFPFISNLNPLRSEAIVWNANVNNQSPTVSTEITWSLTGLAPNATFDMCVYGAQADYNRSFDMTIGEQTHNVATFDAKDAASPVPNTCIQFNNIVSNSAGTITGTGTGIGPTDVYTSEADWAGFQIVEVSSSPVPEPSALLLIGTGAFALATTLRRRLIR